MVLRRSISTVSLGLVVLVLGCATQRASLSAAMPRGGASLTAADESLADELCLFGMPAHESDWERGSTRVVVRAGYALEHADVEKIPVWVCERVKKAHTSGTADRNRCSFKPEYEIAKGARAELADYKGSGFDRGHQAPAADFKYDQDRMRESFVLSNVAPQVGSGFNRGIWRVLEQRVRACVDCRGEVYVITGPLFCAPDEDGPQAAHESIGQNRVAVPTHFYKILVARNVAGAWEAVAFVLENQKHAKEKDAEYSFAGYVKPIDWIEETTGLNFMPDLDTDDPALEERLERKANPVWPCLN